MIIKFLTMERMENRPVNQVGSSRIRARWVYKYWDEADEFTIGDNPDVLIFQKAYWKDMLEQFKGIKILDICDADWLDPRPVFETISCCDAVVTSTEPLAEYIRKLTDKKVVCIPDRLDMDEMNPYKLKHEGDLKSAVWYGYSQNQDALDKTVEHLKQRGISLTVISNQPYSSHPSYGSFKVNNVKYAYDKTNEEIIKHDIVLLPSPEGIRGKYKSNNKITNAWGLGMPVAVEPSDLDKFKTQESREEERKLRMAEVVKDYDVKISVVEWKELIDAIS